MVEVEEEVVVVEAVSEGAAVEDLEAAAAEDLEVDEVEEEVSEGEVEEDEDSEVGDDLTAMVWCDGLLPVLCYTSKKAVPLPGLLDSEYGHCLCSENLNGFSLFCSIFVPVLKYDG